MATLSSDDVLIDVLAESQRLGFLGERPVVEVIEHARAFVRALDECVGPVVDLGAGGGVPGFVLAHDRPDLTLTMVDRRAKRTDFLSRMVRRLGWSERVEVVAGDVRSVIADRPQGFGAAIARGFGPPEITLGFGADLVCPGGFVVISEPPEGDRWQPADLGKHGVERLDSAPNGVVVFRRQ